MKIEKRPTYYGYDLLINNVLHKRCLNCNSWYEFSGELGVCKKCLQKLSKLSGSPIIK
ncbi:hypothetical protein [Litchfieldia alkalitelluris]|uniref:hypothetical protein n=1 Tax=Litchfieldia alkalitelluris TaxID=304268 RepID=UPI0014744A8E|nr:hypothetical protein [Litchfieldia alkalitelluris]